MTQTEPDASFGFPVGVMAAIASALALAGNGRPVISWSLPLVAIAFFFLGMIGAEASREMKTTLPPLATAAIVILIFLVVILIAFRG